MKSLLAALALLSASPIFINQAHSNEALIAQDTNSEVDQSKKTYTSEGKEIQTVIAIGIGTSPQGAAQNAAENALTQVVGSFIDAETILTKKTEIRDGVVAKSKELSKKISDYSQGSIKSFEILNTSQNGSIYNVTARVDVRIEDFRAYIKELAYGSKKINTGLFSVIKTEEDNLQEKLDLLAKVVNPVINGEVIEITIGNPERFKEVSAFGCYYSENEKNIQCLNGEQFIQRIYLDREIKKNNSIVVPVTFKLKESYLENIVQILENISDGKKSYSKDYIPKNTYSAFQNVDTEEDLLFSIVNREKKESFLYLLSSTKKLNYERKNSQKVNLIDCGNYTYDEDKLFPNLKFTFKDKESKTLLSFTQERCMSKTLSYSPVIYFFPVWQRRINGQKEIVNLFHGSDRSKKLSFGQIRDSFEALLIIEPNEELLNNLHEISIEYVQR